MTQQNIEWFEFNEQPYLFCEREHVDPVITTQDFQQDTNIFVSIEKFVVVNVVTKRQNYYKAKRSTE